MPQQVHIQYQDCDSEYISEIKHLSDKGDIEIIIDGKTLLWANSLKEIRIYFEE